MEPVNTLAIYTKTLSGHRSSYLQTAVQEFGGSQIKRGEIISHRGPVLFLMLEEDFFFFVFSALFRALFSRRTVALVFRPVPKASSRNLKLSLKFAAMRALRKIKYINLISIISEDLQPAVLQSCDASIYDFQFWDIRDCDRQEYMDLTFATLPPEVREVQLENSPSQQKSVVSLGTQFLHKGIEALCSAELPSSTGERLVKIVAGKVPTATALALSPESLSKLHVIDRFITDKELLSLYKYCDLIWCAYEKSYDQSSGILGRCLQFGKVPIVRSGSISETACEMFGIDYYVVDEAQCLKKILRKEASAGFNSNTIRKRSVSVLKENLGI